MKIVKLSAQNIKRLKVVEISPAGNIVQITGPNASGKTSVLDCIYMALAGASAIPSKPVREGEDSAKIVLDLGECIVTRKFTSDGKSSLTVEALSGSRFPSPQRMLDSLLSGLSFDPLAFTRMDSKGQLETLRKLVKLDTDVDALDGQNARDYESRTEVNREIKRLEGQLAGIKIPETKKEDLELDEPSLRKQLTEAAEVNGNIQKVKLAHSNAMSSAEVTERAITTMEEELTRLRKKLDVEVEAFRLAASQVDALREPINTLEIAGKIDRALLVSNAKRLMQQRDDLTAQMKGKVDEAHSLTQKMEQRLKEKEEAISRAEMPVRGLTFGSGEVLYKGVPFAQASSAEQLLISTAIAMNAAPKLKILRIQDGSLLDKNSLALIGRLAEKGDYQCWIETVQSDDPMAIHMSDGEIVSQPKPE